jgi:hypothetical protein
MLKMNFKPDPKALRQFAWVAIVGLPLVAGLVLRLCGVFSWTHPVFLAAVGLGVAQAVLFQIGVQAVTRATFVGLMVVAAPIGFVLSHVLMAVVYFLLITPMGLVFRLIGRDAIGRKWDAKAATYWHVRGAVRPKASYFKLY